MSAHHPPENVPTPMLWACGALIAAALAGAGLAGATGVGAAATQEMALTDYRDVLLRDEADGGIGVYDFETGQVISQYPPHSGGFIRVAARSLTLERRLSGVGPEAPFRVLRGADGALALHDPTTDRRVVLSAFGGANAREFDVWFNQEGGA